MLCRDDALVDEYCMKGWFHNLAVLAVGDLRS